MGDNRQEIRVVSQGCREAAIRALVARQSGNVSRAQLLGVGLSEGAIEGRLRSGALVRRYRGVYALAPARRDPPAVAAAAVLAGGPQAVASHVTAGYLWGLVSRWEPVAEITLMAGDRRPRGIVTHRCASLTRRDTTHQLSVPVTTRARTILDLAPRLDAGPLTRLVNDARRAGYLHPATFQDILARHPYHPGTALLTAYAQDPANPTRSGFEDEFRAFTQKYDLPTPLINVRVHGREVDAFFPEHRLIVEADGWLYHRDREAFEDDRDRDAENLRHGLATVRVTKRRLRRTPDREAERLQDILQGRWAVLGSSYGLLPEL